MGREIDGNTIDPSQKIRTVIEVEATQKILIRLSVTRVLRHDQSGHYLEQLADS